MTDIKKDHGEYKNRAGRSEVSDTASVVNEVYNRTQIISGTLTTLKLTWTALHLNSGFTIEMRNRIIYQFQCFTVHFSIQ